MYQYIYKQSVLQSTYAAAYNTISMTAAAALAITALSPPADDTPVTEYAGPEIAVAAV